MSSSIYARNLKNDLVLKLRLFRKETRKVYCYGWWKWIFKYLQISAWSSNKNFFDIDWSYTTSQKFNIHTYDYHGEVSGEKCTIFVAVSEGVNVFVSVCLWAVPVSRSSCYPAAWGSIHAKHQQQYECQHFEQVSTMMLVLTFENRWLTHSKASTRRMHSSRMCTARAIVIVCP